MWNVLNLYKKKLKVAESDIENLRDNLANEKTRLLNLEKELQNLKATCACIDIRPTETSSAQTYESRGSYASASPQADEPCISESSDEIEQAGGVDSSLIYSQDHADPNNPAEDLVGLMQNQSVREPAIDLSSYSESPDKPFGKQDTQQYVEINEEQPCGSKASQGFLKDSNLDDSCNGASIKVSYSQTHILLQEDSCSTIELDDRQSSGGQVSSDLPAATNNVTLTAACSSLKDPETSTKLESSCQLPNPEKTRRRLLPASSVLVRNVSYWDLGDDDKKSKGSKGGKKKDPREESRTKGNANLLRLLKGDLRI